MRTKILATFLSVALSPLFSPAQERPAAYPFDVNVAGQEAVFNPRIPIFAKIPEPVAADAVVTLKADPGAIIVNLFPCAANGSVTQGVEPKVVMVGRGTSFKLNQTMDKSTLASGFYVMNIVLRSKGTARVMFTVGAAAAPDQSTPEKTLAIMFASAKSGDFAPLKLIVPASGDLDGDVERVRDVAEASEADQKFFKDWFSTGKIVGEARIEGDKAAVDFLFGPKGERDETMNLTLKDGKWYLDSF